jgi:dihydroorotate dehydrogenase (NAD+) catalytic subunit
MVHVAAKMVKIPICGLGGIMNANDIIEFVMAGATLVQIGTANFIKPDIAIDILNDLEEFIDTENIKSLDEIRGII